MTCSTDYERVAAAIEYIRLHFKEQPSLDEIAAVVGLSTFHFQRMFTNWAGVSPKKFTQYLSLEYAKNLLKHEQASLLDTAHATGMSGPSRLHDLFVKIEGMTPGEFKNGGATLAINYSFAESPFGKLIVASTRKGVCHMFFVEDEHKALAQLKGRFPNAAFHPHVDTFQQSALRIFRADWGSLDKVKLHLNGTEFQLKVWEHLLRIPLGGLMSYSAIAQSLDMPKASRAVGSAIGRNPVAFLIPCHRVIQASAGIGGYMWGDTRKRAIIGWEAAKISTTADMQDKLDGLV